MNDETTLIPCPWCSEYPKIAEDGGSTGPWFCVWHDCPPVEGGKARHYGESLGCISITTAWFHTEAEAIAVWNTRAAKTIGKVQVEIEPVLHGTLTAEQVERIVYRNCEWYEGGEIDAQAIADELNAELGSGTCKWTWVEEWTDTDAGRECDYAHWTLDCGCWDVYDEHFQDFDDYESKPKGIGFCERCGKAVER